MAGPETLIPSWRREVIPGAIGRAEHAIKQELMQWYAGLSHTLTRGQRPYELPPWIQILDNGRILVRSETSSYPGIGLDGTGNLFPETSLSGKSPTDDKPLTGIQYLATALEILPYFEPK